MKYAETHEWVDVKNGKGRIGISFRAQKELGEIVYIELPEVGQVIQAEQQVVVLESTKAAVDIYSPVSGKVSAINESVREAPSLLNQDPEGKGYLFEIILTYPEELDKLLSKDLYDQTFSK